MVNKRLFIAITVLILLMGCSTLRMLESKPYTLPWVGHWAEQQENGSVRHWNFHSDGTFEAIEISYHPAGGNKIFDIKKGAYDFGRGRYILAYIQSFKDEPPVIRKKRQPTVDISFVGPRPFIEVGTFELKDGYLTLISEKGVKTTLYK